MKKIKKPKPWGELVFHKEKPIDEKLEILMERIKDISFEHQDRGSDIRKKKVRDIHSSLTYDDGYGRGLYQIYMVMSQFFSPVTDWDRELMEDEELNERWN